MAPLSPAGQDPSPSRGWPACRHAALPNRCRGLPPALPAPAVGPMCSGHERSTSVVWTQRGNLPHGLRDSDAVCTLSPTCGRGGHTAHGGVPAPRPHMSGQAFPVGHLLATLAHRVWDLSKSLLCQTPERGDLALFSALHGPVYLWHVPLPPGGSLGGPPATWDVPPQTPACLPCPAPPRPCRLHRCTPHGARRARRGRPCGSACVVWRGTGTEGVRGHRRCPRWNGQGLTEGQSSVDTEQGRVRTGSAASTEAIGGHGARRTLVLPRGGVPRARRHSQSLAGCQ